MRAFYGYSINATQGKGLYISETYNNWFKVQDDPLNREFFSIEDIEKALNVTLTLRKVLDVAKRIIN